MMRRKNLERAVVLGLLLSTSVYGNAVAAEVTTSEFQNAQNVPVEGISVNGNNYTVSADTIVNGPVKGNATQWEWLGGKTIDINKGVNVTFNELWLNNANITGKGNISVCNTKGTPVWISGYIQTDNLKLSTIDGSSKNANGISTYDGDVTLDVNNLDIVAVNNGILTQAEKSDKMTVNINDTQSVNINMLSDGIGIHITNNADFNMISTKSDSVINVMAGNGVSTTSGQSNAILKADYVNIGAWSSWGVVADNGRLEIEAKKDVFIGDKFTDEEKIGDYATQAARATNGQLIITAKEGNVRIIGNEGVFTNRTSTTGSATITAGQNNYIYAGTNTLQAAGGNITVSGQNNFIKADSDVRSSKFDFEYGDSLAISPENSSITTVTATGENGLNDIRGAVSAAKGASTVNITGFSNNVYSAAVIDGAGDLAGKTQIDNPDPNGDKFTGMDVVSALYAEEGADINLSGVNNIQTYYGDPNDEHTSERAVWAYKGANITLDGTTNISTYKYEVSPENRDIAIAAGTATELDKDDFTEEALGKVEMASVNLNYQAGSSISGDILAAYGGEVNIKDNNITTASVGRSGAATGINITGDLLAGNTGKLTVDLGNGGNLTGRADDYGDAYYSRR